MGRNLKLANISGAELDNLNIKRRRGGALAPRLSYLLKLSVKYLQLMVKMLLLNERSKSR